MRQRGRAFGGRATYRWIFVALAGVAVAQGGQAQTPARRNPTRQAAVPKPAAPPGAEQPKFKGVWEPVNYPDDIFLHNVFFVSDKVGWAGGYSARAGGSDTGGVLIHTADGGAHWDLQLGDPESSQAGFYNLFFLDTMHGWVTQSDKLLRTSDGLNWEQAGSFPPGGLNRFVFTSPRHGIGVSEGQFVVVTADGGRTWKRTFQCTVRLEVNGLTRNSGCNLNALHFPSQTIGYVAGGGDGFVVVAKTEDGGATWAVIFSSTDDHQADGIFFTDENTGFMRVSSTKLQTTSDGGRTWHGVPTPVPDTGRILFADPEVGWICGYRSMAFSGDSGHRWNSRDFHFPADVYGWSLPRRNRAYAVGQHGMVYRYRVVPATYQAVAHSIDAPVMPGFDSPVFGEVATLNDVVAKLRAKLPAVAAAPGQSAIQPGAQPGGQASTQSRAQAAAFQQDANAPSSAGGAAPNPLAGTGASPSAGFPQDAGTVLGAAPAGTEGGFQQNVGTGPVPGGYMDSCCGPLIQQLETTSNSFATNVPAFSQRFRNLNLILEGLNFLNSVVNQANTLKQSIRTLRQAKNAQAAAAALNTVQTQVNGISSSGGFVQDTTLPPPS